MVTSLAIESRLSLQHQDIGNDTSTIRSLDWDRSRFDIEFGLRNGTTYNAFIIEGEYTALIDSSHAKFRSTWIPLLKTCVNPKNINYLIVSHTEPDHSGLISDLVELNPSIEIIASKVAIQFLKSQIHRPFKSRAVKSGDELNLGINPESKLDHRLEFLSAPNLHWPDTIFSFDHGSNILFTCDAFGLHYCSDDIFDVNPGAIAADFRFYYDCLMGPNARSVLQALKRMKALPDIKTIATGHGPLLQQHIPLWLRGYREWSKAKGFDVNYVAICYISEYGFCDRLSQAIAHGIGKTEIQAQLIDLRGTDIHELTPLISDAKAVIIPTWPNQPDMEMQNAISTLFAAFKSEQLVGVYDAYGGNDEPVDTITEKLRNIGQKSAFEPLRIHATPEGSDYQRCEEAGTDLGQLLARDKSIAIMKSLDGDLDKALGRVSGGLYVVTARQGDRSSAMVASWVSQASFDPPGLTVAVAKDRAIEALMQVGDNFVLNILNSNNYQPLIRHFLKRFPPGADRFKGVKVLNDSSISSPILADALAYLDCQVSQRMEGPDHWIIYALVKTGNISDNEATTAVHHRKVGNHY